MLKAFFSDNSQTLPCVEIDTDAQAFSFGSIPAKLCNHPGGWLAGYALALTLNLAEETVRFTTDTSREEEFIGLARGIAIAEG
jgi:hypothetical protein